MTTVYRKVINVVFVVCILCIIVAAPVVMTFGSNVVVVIWCRFHFLKLNVVVVVVFLYLMIC